MHPAISDKTLTWAATIGSGVMNGLSRVIFGASVDKIGFKKIFLALMIIQLINSLVSYWAAWMPAAYFICVLVNYMAIGGLYAIFPVTVTNLFGLEIGPKVYIWILLGGNVVSVINLLETAVFERLIGFVGIFYVNSAFQLLSIIVTYFYKEELDVERLRKYGGLKSQEYVAQKEFKKDQGIELENSR